ncbi:hypothetical protein AX16_002207 [Volvariella volvacea WC 439]|nr:hypothetical protein AX16_002207 [Volvariella volvacea WC 439]
MLLASLFLAALARSLASPVPISAPGTATPSPVCIVAAAITASQCDPTRTRTIFDILYSCIGVILLCTYISIHHNIPDQNDSWAKVAWLKLRTSLYALLAPEMVIMWAIRQRIMAGKIAEQNKDRGWTKTHGFFVQMGGLMQQVEDAGEIAYQVACVEIMSAEEWRNIKLPRITEKEIRDHGKGDILAKAIVVLQTTWFVAQCIARRAQGLVLTELELVTLAFATLNVITYGLWWDKPLNIEYPIYFDDNGNRVDGPEENRSRAAWYKEIWKSVRGYSLLEDEGPRQERRVTKKIWETGVKAPFKALFGPIQDMMREEGESNRTTSVHPFYAAEMNDDDQALAVVYSSVIGTAFGAIHMIGWNFHFETGTELWLWRASSLVLIVIPLNLGIAAAVGVAYNKATNSFLENMFKYISNAFIYPSAFIGAPLYFVARIALLFLAFFTLRALPDSAYQNVRWTEFIPHI